jgi:hypothetical protein
MNAIENILGRLATSLIRFQEHFRDFKYGNGKSKFAQHLIDNKYSIALIEDSMEILHVSKKRKYDGHP